MRPKLLLICIKVGLNRTGHMTFLTGQDQTPKFAGQVLPDRSESGIIFFAFYQRNKQQQQQNYEQKFEKKIWIFYYL